MQYAINLRILKPQACRLQRPDHCAAADSNAATSTINPSAGGGARGAGGAGGAAGEAASLFLLHRPSPCFQNDTKAKTLKTVKVENASAKNRKNRTEKR